MHVFVKKLHPNVYDVFLGNGYDNWTRVRRNHYGLNVIAGNRLPHGILREVAKHVR